MMMAEAPNQRWGIAVGMQVDIKRSDGRVHPAVVSGINEATESVTVEWFENQETKGKELDLRHVAALNPSVAQAIKQSKKPAAAAPAAAAPAAAAPAPSKVPARRQTKSAGSKAPAAAKPAPSLRKQAAAPASSPALEPKIGKAHKVANKIQQIADKREERRAKQEAGRRKDAAEKESRANNPNWDFGMMVEDFRESHISVCIRKRPLNKKEIGRSDVDVITIPDGEHTMAHECKLKVDLTKYLENHNFRFDHSFDETVGNEEVYQYTAAPLVETIFAKGFATCFAYGQTGSGKTHTMGGEFNEGVGVPDSTAGIYAFAARDVFKYNAMPENVQKNLTISVSFFEIYGGKVFDLLNQQKRLRVLEDGKQNVNIVGLAEQVVLNIDEVLGLLHDGVQLRASGTTSANQNSSRSHAIFQIILRTNDRKKSLHGKFSLIDLAGNERGADTSQADRKTRMEGSEINKSLLALKECIRALSKKSKHTPYRASKLTQVLRDSFIHKNARTCMIAMISPGLASCENSLNTLRYADRVKELKKGAKGKVKAVKVGPGSLAGGAASAAPAMIIDDVGSDIDDDDGGWLGEPTPLEASLAKHDLAMLHQSIIRGKGGKASVADNAQFEFQNAVAEVVEAEEKVVEEHRAMVEADKGFRKQEDKLLKEVDTVDFDADDYSKRLDKLLDDKIAKLMSLKASVATFRKHLAAEEGAAKAVKSGFKF
eukprot:gene8010-29062_t